MKPPIPYLGGKMTLGPRIAELFPEHLHYVEPYCGSLAVLLAKRPSAHETVNDLDRELVTFWRVLRDRRKDLQRVCELTPHSRAEHAAAFDLDVADEVERARRVWVQLTQGRAAVRSDSTGWRHYEAPIGNTSMGDYLAGYTDRMPPVVDRLRRVSLECREALEVVSAYGKHSDVLLYVDPPYLGSTRVSGGYVHEMKTEADHRELAEALLDCKAAVVLSGYHSSLYDELYGGWDRVSFATATGQGGSWESRTEVLWSNRPLNLHPTLFDLPQKGAA